MNSLIILYGMLYEERKLRFARSCGLYTVKIKSKANLDLGVSLTILKKFL